MNSDDIAGMPDWHPDELYSLPVAQVEEFQLAVIKQRFDELRPRIRVLDSIASDVGVDRIDELGDIVPLCVPHTIYKSYSSSHVEKGRFDRLTQWLDGLTAEDLSAVETGTCDSLESWLDAIESASTLRPLVSSGTTGKVSFFPRSTTETDVFIRYVVQSLKGFRNEADSGLHTGEPDFFMPVPMASGRQNIPRMLELLRTHCYDGDAGRIHTLGRGHWDADMLWLWGRMRQADRLADGQLDLSPAWDRVRDRVLGAVADAAAHREQFFHELLVEFRGRRVLLFAPLAQLIELAGVCSERGIVPAFGPGSFLLTGGGTKGHVFPDGWEGLLHGMFPPPYEEWYAMTESTAISRLCAAGWFHWPPTIVPFLVDPDTGRPLPRTGTRTGRLALFDLCPTTHWGGAISGDRVSIDWDGGCPCGRTGPRVRNDVVRYSELRDDDKITCAKSPEAYQRAVDALLGQV